MIVVGLDPDREPGDVLDRVFPPTECDESFADDYYRCLRPIPTPAGEPTMTITLTDLPDGLPILLETYEGHVSLQVFIEQHETFCVTPVRTPDPAEVASAGDLAVAYQNLVRSVSEQTDRIRRELTPDDARALAAALTHYAAECER